MSVCFDSRDLGLEVIKSTEYFSSIPGDGIKLRVPGQLENTMFTANCG